MQRTLPRLTLGGLETAFHTQFLKMKWPLTSGRPTPWVYQDAQGNWHWTRGNQAHPFLKPAVADHPQTYRNIIEDELKNG